MTLALRWKEYFMCQDDEFVTFWQERLSQQENGTLVVVGCGFDPRASVALERFLSLGCPKKVHCLLTKYSEVPEWNQPMAKMVSANKKRIENLFDGRQSHLEFLDPQSYDARTVSDRIMERIDFEKYDDVVIDISAFSRYYFYTLISSAVHRIDSHTSNPNLHVVVSSNPLIDERVKPTVESDAIVIPYYGSALGAGSTEHLPRVWFPVLGSKREHHLRKIQEEYPCKEIYPVFPFPSSNLRRVDELVEEYREVLYDSFQVDPQDYILASEDNPFNLYRQLVNAACYLSAAFQPLGGCIFNISPLSSKLLTVGTLLAAYELSRAGMNVAVTYVRSSDYYVEDVTETDIRKSRLVSLWVAGECYEP